MSTPPLPRRRRRPRQLESLAQRALFDWARKHEARYPELRWLYAVPNGGLRSKATAGRLKAEGVKAGVPDIALDIARKGYHGLRIELKIPPNTPSIEQIDWSHELTQQGYYVRLCTSWREAWNTLMTYLGYPYHWPEGAPL